MLELPILILVYIIFYDVSRLPVGPLAVLGRLLPQARDVFAALKDAALRVAIKITYANLGKAEQHPLILPTDFLLALASRNRFDLLLPAKDLESSALVLEEYWKRFKAQYGEDHGVFRHVSAQDLRHCVPIKIHGDEGRSTLATLSDNCKWLF